MSDEISRLQRKFAKLLDSKKSDDITMRQLNTIALRIEALRKKGG